MSPRALLFLPGQWQRRQSVDTQPTNPEVLFVGGCKHVGKYEIPSMAAAEHVLTKLLFIVRIQPTSFDTCPQAPR